MQTFNGEQFEMFCSTISSETKKSMCNSMTHVTSESKMLTLRGEEFAGDDLAKRGRADSAYTPHYSSQKFSTPKFRVVDPRGV